MNRAFILTAAAVSLSLLSGSARADNFFIALLQSANWQVPKCKAPEVLTEVKDRAGNIHFVCKTPKTAK